MNPQSERDEVRRSWRRRNRDWDENNRHLCVKDAHGVEADIRAHFSLPEIAYIGSSLGRGCGFQSVSFQGGDWPEQWMIEQGECDPPDDHIQDHNELYDLVSTLLSEGHSVELYGCWDGDERCETAHQQTIPAHRLLDEKFWFRERGLYRIIQGEKDGGEQLLDRRESR